MNYLRTDLRFLVALLTAAALLPSTAKASDGGTSLVVKLEGMDCAGCNSKVTGALAQLSFVTSVEASFVEQAACANIDGVVDEAQVTAAIATTGYRLVAIEAVPTCPEGLRGHLPDPWAGRTDGLDVLTISNGEEVDLDAHLVADKYTVVDFGAAWCAPCHEAAELLAAYLGDHPDVAVRAIELGGETADASYEQPVVAQHLQYVKGIPWFVLYAPSGKVLSRTQSPAKVIKAIDKHRARRGSRK